MEIKISGQSFKSKAELARKCQELQNLYFQKGNIEGEDRIFLEALFNQHPRKESKLKTGIFAVYCDLAPLKATKCFWILRNDGSNIDISWNRCINKEDSRNEVLRVMRRAVADQIIEFKKKIFGDQEVVPSAISGILLKWNDVHIDHFNPSFIIIAEHWIGDRNWSEIQIDHSNNLAEFTNAADCRSWSDYHKENAHLRVISITENLSRTDEN